MSGQILTDITQQFNQATVGWHHYLFPIANKLFGALAAIEIAWAGIWWALEKDMVSIWTELQKRMMSLGLFYSVLLYSDKWVPAIIDSFGTIGAGASGLPMLYPSDVFGQGVSIASNIFLVFHNTGIFSMGLSTLVGVAAGIIVLIAFAIIAGFLMVTLVESYIVLGAGVLFLGFSSHRLTAKFAMSYLSYAMGIGAKLFMSYLVIGVGGAIANGWITTFKGMPSVEVTPFLEIMGGAIVYLMCALAIPHKAESLMSGASHASLGGLLGATSLVVTTGLVAGKLAAGAVRGVMGAGSSAIEAVKQAQAVGQGLGVGKGGYALGAVGAGFNTVTSAVGSAVGHHRRTHSAMAQKTANIRSHFAERCEKRAAGTSVRPMRTPPPAPPVSAELTTIPEAKES